jgi:hypothetical protein
MTTPYFAAYDAAAVYACDPTESGALAESRLFLGDDSAPLQVARVTPELAAWIEVNGWDGATETFAVHDGWIVRTTGAV